MKRLRPFTALLATAMLLAGCALTPSVPPRAVYDLGPPPAPPAASTAAGPIAWRLADVTAAPAIAGEGIAYRLAFQQAQRLEVYRDSTWAAPPAALLTQRLREQAAAAAPCTPRAPGLITVHLDAFEQVFSSPSMMDAAVDAPGDAPRSPAIEPSAEVTTSVPNCRTPPFSLSGLMFPAGSVRM